jgi:hypothetical protein
MEHGKPWVNYNETPSPIAKRGLHLRKIMTFVWWYVNGIICLQAAITDHSIMKKFYCQHLSKQSIEE